jgi:hypothetical protein
MGLRHKLTPITKLHPVCRVADWWEKELNLRLTPLRGGSGASHYEGLRGSLGGLP